MKIISKQILADNPWPRIVSLEILALEIASKAKAGQFVALMVSKEGERIPLTIVESDPRQGRIRLIFQESGLTTKKLGACLPKDSLYALAGPLGQATEIKNYGQVILVGGGVGIAEIYPVAKALKLTGNKITVILGAKNKEVLILEKELQQLADQAHIVTDDGSCGEKGFTTDKLAQLLKEGKCDLVYAVGPIPMMRKVAQITGPYAVRTIVSLNALMVDATGMCGCCRVTVDGKVKFSCVDGPEFDADKVDWDELSARNRMYAESEKHICRINLK